MTLDQTGRKGESPSEVSAEENKLTKIIKKESFPVKDSFSARILLIVPLSRPRRSVDAVMYAYPFAGVIFCTVAEYVRNGSVPLLDTGNGFDVGLACASIITLSAIAAEVVVRELVAFEAPACSTV